MYVGLSLLVSYAGRYTQVGFLELLIFSLLLTPLVTAVLTVLFGSKRRKSKQMLLAATSAKSILADKNERVTP